MCATISEHAVCHFRMCIDTHQSVKVLEFYFRYRCGYKMHAVLCRHHTMFFASLLAAHCDDSWTQAYNAAWVRVKASGVFDQTINTVAPSLLGSLRTLGDCPAVPESYPFPPVVDGSLLDQILASGKVRLAFQFNSTDAEQRETLTPGDFGKAFVELAKGIVSHVSLAYNVDLALEINDYESSSLSVDAVVAGDADMTDMFLRQWTLIPSSNQQRRTLTTPSCSLWLATLSASWNATSTGWERVEDLQNAGSQVVIPLYSTMLPFQSDIRRLFPEAVLLERPEQNFEVDREDLITVLQEFQRGETTVLMAAKSDLAGVLGFTLADVDLGFNLDDVRDDETNIDLPVGAMLRTATTTSNKEIKQLESRVQLYKRLYKNVAGTLRKVLLEYTK